MSRFLQSLIYSHSSFFALQTIMIQYIRYKAETLHMLNFYDKKKMSFPFILSNLNLFLSISCNFTRTLSKPTHNTLLFTLQIKRILHLQPAAQNDAAH